MKRKFDHYATSLPVPAVTAEDLALAACRSIIFAGKQAARHGGEYSLTDLQAAERLATEALSIKQPARRK
jgi:hypothetical protein